MFVLVVVIGLFALMVAAVVYDQVRLARRRNVDRGFRRLSMQASRRLQFRQPVRTDEAFFLQMAGDPVAADANGWTGDEVDAVRRRFADRREFAKHKGGEMVAFDRSTSVAVGTATFSLSSLDGVARSIGLHVHPDHRCKGYGREIMAGAITLLQYEPGPVHVGTRVDNIGMQRIMQQLGYHPLPGTQPFVAPNAKSYEGYWYHCGADTHPPLGLYDV